MAFAPGGDEFIPGGDHVNLCLAWNKSASAWRNSPCLNAASVDATRRKCGIQGGP